MKDFVASRVCWTIATSCRTSAPGLARIGRHEPLDDLGLEHDVRQALGRSVVHRAGDLAAQVLLGTEQEARDGGRDAAGVGEGLLGGGRSLRGTRRRRHVAEGGERLGVHREGVAVSAEGPSLALQDVDLRLHQGGALGQEHELRVEVGRDARVDGGPRGGRGRRGGRDLLGGRDPTRLVPGGLGPGLRDQQVDLAELRVEVGHLIGHPPGEFGEGGRRRGRGCEVGHRAMVGSGVSISLPASGSSPGASRTRRPGSGR